MADPLVMIRCRAEGGPSFCWNHGGYSGLSSSCPSCDRQLMEMDCALGPDADRVIPPPLPEPVVEVDPVLRARVWRWATVVSIALIAAGLWMVFAPSHAQSPALVVLVGPR